MPQIWPRRRRRYGRRRFRRARRFRRSRHYRHYGRRAVRWAGRWLQGPSCHRTVASTGTLPYEVNTSAAMYTMMGGLYNLPLQLANNIPAYDTERHSQRIKLLTMKFSATIFWPDHDPDGVDPPANPAERCRIIIFLGRCGLSNAEMTQWVQTPGAPLKSLQAPVEQGHDAGVAYRPTTAEPRPFVKHVFYDRTFRRSLQYYQPSRTRFTVKLPVRGLKFQYGMYQDDYNYVVNQDIWLLVQADNGPDTNLTVGNILQRMTWREGKPAAGAFQAPPAAAEKAVFPSFLKLRPVAESYLPEEIDEDDQEELVADLTREVPV